MLGGRPFPVVTGGARLAGERWEGPGDGPAVLLLHPGVADRRCWREVAEGLEGRATLLAYDRRGCGASEPPSSRFSHLDDLVAVMTAVSEGPLWLVGSSAGGGLALDAALLHPARVAGMVLFAPAVTGAPPPLLDPASRRLDRLREAASASGALEEVNRLDLWLWLDGPRQPEGRVAGPPRQLAREMNATILRSLRPELVDRRATGAWSRLGEVSAPTTVACGDLDVPALCERAKELAGRLPGAHHEILPGMAHLPFLERPAAVVDVITRALKAAGT